jgi:hypothetical protein
MAAAHPPTQILDQLVEYPLPPPKTGVRDYVCYFVAPGDRGYGGGAHTFFDRFYKQHHPLPAKVGDKHASQPLASLEALMRALAAHVAAHAITQIRELVIVAHGTPQGLVPPILDGASATNQPQYQYTTPYSLAVLQADLKGPKLTTLAANRKAVVSRLLDDSWVTIRACRVGSSAECLYALYSFFGGRANVYAPTQFQFFGPTFVGPGMRVQTTLDVHDHLVKQHLLPTDEHTPDRQDAIVGALIDPGKFSAPFALASLSLSHPTPDETDAYKALLDTLDASTLSPELKDAFAAAGNPLSAPRFVQLVKGGLWRVYDKVVHAGQSYRVVYTIEELVDVVAHKSTLTGSAQIATAVSRGATLPIQLFFVQTEHDQFKGQLFQLGGYAEGPGGDPTAQQTFTAMKAALDAGQISNDIRAKFKSEQDIDLSTAPPPQVKVATKTGSGGTERITWAVTDGAAQYRIELTHPATADDTPSHLLSVYSVLDDKSSDLQKAQLMATLGVDPDVPGPELAAYLDRFTIDELTALIDDLRNPYRAANSFLIHHAQQAIQRKREYFTWWQQQYLAAAEHDVLVRQPYSEMQWSETQDLAGLAFDFDFNSNWHEVKVSFPTPPTFQSDLFLDGDIATTLKLGDGSGVGDLLPDSPAFDADGLRALEAKGVEPYFSADKTVLDRRHDGDTSSCPDFEAAINKWKELQGQDPNQIIETLKSIEGSDDRNLWDYFCEFLEAIHFHEIDLAVGLVDMTLLEEGLVDRFAMHVIGIENPVILALIWVSPSILIPFFMWLHILNVQVEADEAWKGKGRLTAARVWLYEFITLTRQVPMPSDPQIDLTGRDATHEYLAELRAETGIAQQPLVWAPDKMQEGFDEVAERMKRIGGEIMAKVDQAIADTMAGWQLSACKIKVLADAGVLVLDQARAAGARRVAENALKQLPRL